MCAQCLMFSENGAVPNTDLMSFAASNLKEEIRPNPKALKANNQCGISEKIKNDLNIFSSN